MVLAAGEDIWMISPEPGDKLSDNMPEGLIFRASKSLHKIEAFLLRRQMAGA